MKIIADENIPFVKAAFANIGKIVTIAGRDISNADLLDADILLVRSITKVNQQLLENTTIKIVATATSGINHIDLEYLQQNNILFAAAFGSNANSVAQYVISAICYWSLQQGRTLQDLSLGIIGYGNVGKKVEKFAKFLQLKCVINDPPLAEQNPNNFADIEVALACDIITLHMPFTTTGKYATCKLINQRRIKQLNKNILFINSSRGEVINEAVLLAHKIEHDDISLVLDVWENEPNINHQTLAHTLLATPHIAGYSYDAKLKGTEMIYKACCKFLNISATWSIADIDSDENTKPKNKKSGQHDIRQACLTAYDIYADNLRLKMLLDNSDLDTARYFDHLRKDYPIRREW